MAEAQKQGLTIDEFSDIKKWWRNAEPTDENIKKFGILYMNPLQLVGIESLRQNL